MMNPLLPLFLSLATIVTPLQAAPPTPQTKAALQKIVASQDIEAMWPAIVASSAQTSAARVQDGARQSIDAMPDLSQAQRRRAYAVIAEVAPAIAAEISERHRRLPVRAWFTDMAAAVYPKYFTAREIDELASHFGGPAYVKLMRIEAQASEEAARTGRSFDAVAPSYLRQLTVSDQASLAAFASSPTGRKHRELGQAVSDDSRRYLLAMMGKDVEAVTSKYDRLLRDKLRRALRE